MLNSLLLQCLCLLAKNCGPDVSFCADDSSALCNRLTGKRTVLLPRHYENDGFYCTLLVENSLARATVTKAQLDALVQRVIFPRAQAEAAAATAAAVAAAAAAAKVPAVNAAAKVPAVAAAVAGAVAPAASVATAPSSAVASGAAAVGSAAAASPPDPNLKPRDRTRKKNTKPNEDRQLALAANALSSDGEHGEEEEEEPSAGAAAAPAAEPETATDSATQPALPPEEFQVTSPPQPPNRKTGTFRYVAVVPPPSPEEGWEVDQAPETPVSYILKQQPQFAEESDPQVLDLPQKSGVTSTTPRIPTTTKFYLLYGGKSEEESPSDESSEGGGNGEESGEEEEEEAEDAAVATTPLQPTTQLSTTSTVRVVRSSTRRHFFVSVSTNPRTPDPTTTPLIPARGSWAALRTTLTDFYGENYYAVLTISVLAVALLGTCCGSCFLICHLKKPASATSPSAAATPAPVPEVGVSRAPGGASASAGDPEDGLQGRDQGRPKSPFQERRKRFNRLLTGSVARGRTGVASASDAAASFLSKLQKKKKQKKQSPEPVQSEKKQETDASSKQQQQTGLLSVHLPPPPPPQEPDPEDGAGADLNCPGNRRGSYDVQEEFPLLLQPRSSSAAANWNAADFVFEEDETTV